MAPPTVTIDLDELKKLAQMQCTDEEIAAWFGVSRSTIARRKRNKVFREIIDNGMAQGRISVRRHLFKESQDGNVAATIFLAKNLLGYKNVIDQRVEDVYGAIDARIAEGRERAARLATLLEPEELEKVRQRMIAANATDAEYTVQAEEM